MSLSDAFFLPPLTDPGRIVSGINNYYFFASGSCRVSIASTTASASLVASALHLLARVVKPLPAASPPLAA